MYITSATTTMTLYAMTQTFKSGIQMSRDRVYCALYHVLNQKQLNDNIMKNKREKCTKADKPGA